MTCGELFEHHKKIQFRTSDETLFNEFGKKMMALGFRQLEALYDLEFGYYHWHYRMDCTIEILTCDTLASLPPIDQILAIPRARTLRIIFLPPILTAFFEQCARDYRSLATDLIHGLARYLKEAIDPQNAMHTFGKYKRGRQTGKMSVWEYH